MKRAVDLIVSLALLGLTAPLFLPAALLVFCTLGRPVLFAQVRPGLHGRPFTLYKLRTMSLLSDGQGRLLPDEQRLNGVGRLLRKTSLDELPQLWNVLKGEMSLVGPRPLLMEYLPLYNDEQRRRHEVPPGITGWAQVNGRNAVSWDERFALDLWYVDNRSLLLDLRILWLTLLRGVAGRGVSAVGHVTMPRFTGNRGIMAEIVTEGGIRVIGAGGHAKVVVATALAAGLEVLGLYDDDLTLVGGELLGVPIRGRICDLETTNEQALVVAVGDNATRRRLVALLAGARWATIVHPRAIVHQSVRLGPGSVVFAGAIIQPESRVGAHAIINTGAVIDHDCRIGDFAHLAPGSCLAGNVRIEAGCLVGIGGVVGPGVRLGDWSVLGAGGAAISDLPANTVAVGVPARPGGSNGLLKKRFLLL